MIEDWFFRRERRISRNDLAEPGRLLVSSQVSSENCWAGRRCCRPSGSPFSFQRDIQVRYFLFVVASLVPLCLPPDSVFAQQQDAKDPVTLFNGRDLDGWEGDSNWFRVQDGAIVGGNLQQKIPHNFFLATKKDYADFELTLEFRLLGTGTNAGIQLRSRRIPDHHEMIGYQADLGQSYWGALYDESRRNKILAAPDAQQLAKVLKKDDWNHYRIRCEGRRIQLWINDLQTVDYTEQDQSLEQTGLIAVQIHGGPPGEAWYRNLKLRSLAASAAAKQQ